VTEGTPPIGTHLTEFGFIVALEISGLVLALTMARAAGAREPGASVYRIVSAVERAVRGYLSRARRPAAGALLLALAAVVSAYALLGRVELVLRLAGGLVVGASLTAVCAALSAAYTARAAGATHASARLGFNAALTATMRAGGAVGIGTETASTLGALALFGVTYLAEGGSVAPSVAGPSLANPCLIVTGYALGAALAALMVDRAGSAYLVGAEAGKGRARFDASGDANDPRNPALVAGLVGDHVGAVASGSALLFALSATATAAAFSCARSIGASPSDELHAAALPLVFRSFGMVGCAAGTLSARADEAQGQSLALLRGCACAFAIALFGILGGSYWLAPGDWWFLAAAGALGLAVSAVPSVVALSLLDRQARPVREAVESLREGASAAFGSSIGHALVRTVLPVAGLVTLTILAGLLGERGMTRVGALAGVSVFALSLSALAPYALTALAMSAIARSARAATALSKLDAESAWRLQRLDDAGFAAAAPARAHLFTASAVAALPAVGAVLATADSQGLGLSGALLCATVAVAVVLGSAGHSARAASLTADEVALEVERQLEGGIGGPAAGTALASDGGPMPAGPAARPLPEGFTPSYRSCEELTQKAASSGLLLGALWALAPLVLLGIGLGLVYRVSGSRLAAAALSTFVATAAVTALGAALAVDGARTVHGSARRLARLERTASPAAPIPEDVLANILGIAAGPAACSQALLVASFALAILVTLTNQQ
jgi:Na+/H+-translocating membrane pyrophosphatase